MVRAPVGARVPTIGAEGHTNNTGELSALHGALTRALRRPKGRGRETIWSDSLYAINMTNGRWMPRSTRNRTLVAALRGMWRRLQRQRPHEVRLMHVRSHTLRPGNEVADWLADAGIRGGMSTENARRDLHRWYGTHNVALHDREQVFVLQLRDQLKPAPLPLRLRVYGIVRPFFMHDVMHHFTHIQHSRLAHCPFERFTEVLQRSIVLLVMCSVVVEI